ncbi:glycosyltransferase family 4 protein [Paenibacillus turpanensis]|uniref:glycosyltransferase family 4 protein n=1 Tax=Paenibacillus turpanensis TaxID=2689078 RepID=UPI00140D26AA|nr:glycosyltransferase family 4 protein [Paenibacillus turpanensis]
MIKDERQRLLWITPGTFPVPSGKSSSVEQAVYNMARRMAPYAEITLLSRRAESLPGVEQQAGIRHVRPRKRRIYLESAGKWLTRLQPDVVLVENRPIAASSLKRRYPKERIWLTLHSLTYISRPNATKAQVCRAFRRVERVIVNSEYLKRELIRKYPAYKGKYVVNHLGVEAEGFPSRWSEAGELLRWKKLNELGYEQDKKLILFVGRLLPMKGVHFAVKAMKEIAEKHPDAVLLVIGSAKYGRNGVTPYVKKLHRIASEIPNHIRFLPFVDHNLIHEWYAAADAVVVPSDPTEAFGLVVVEAMAAGVPVIATNGGGMREIVVDGKTGYLIDTKKRRQQIAEKLDTLLSDYTLLRQMGEAGRKRVFEHFTWQHTSDRLLHMVQGK